MPPIHIVMDHSFGWNDYVTMYAPTLASISAAGLAAWVAIRLGKMQASIERSKIRKDLFEKRFEVFSQTQDFIDFVIAQGDGLHLLGAPQLANLKKSIRLADMLFGPKVSQYMTEVMKTALDYSASCKTLQAEIERGNKAAIDKHEQLQNRLSVHLANSCVDVFRQDLDLK